MLFLVQAYLAWPRLVSPLRNYTIWTFPIPVGDLIRCTMWWVLIIAAAVQRLAGLAPRFEPRCGPSDAAYANINDIIACYHYLDRLGHQNCAVPGYGVVSEF